MQALDLVYIILAGLLVLRGFLKGFTGEFFSIASVAFSVIVAVLFFKSGAGFLRSRYLQMELFPEILAFLIIFIAVFIIGKITEHVIKDIITGLNMNVLDKILGIILGLAESFALIVLSLFVLTIQPVFDPAPLVEQSFFARLFLPFVRAFRV
ncbi:MAG: CvpA family protein [Treponema sp.]|nr:CvpA family protein [Treponema sp.]